MAPRDHRRPVRQPRGADRRMSPDFQPGLQFEWTYAVLPRATVPQLYHDTAFCLDMPDVLATGYMVGMMELACVNGMMPYLDWPREQSLGTMVNFVHFAPTPPGMTLRIKGEVLEVAGSACCSRSKHGTTWTASAKARTSGM
ncbi:hypothetical protein LP419_19275 [Massilia sp. H-1]|nr:hypothetical protein LP419_19275 [Massilia sp. H-1]